MRRQRTRLTAVAGEQIDLCELVVAALGDKGDRFPVGRPARAALAFGAAGQLHRIAAGDGCAPDVRDATPGLPIRIGPREEHVLAIRRQLRLAQARNVEQIDEPHRTRRLRVQRG